MEGLTPEVTSTSIRSRARGEGHAFNESVSSGEHFAHKTEIDGAGVDLGTEPSWIDKRSFDMNPHRLGAGAWSCHNCGEIGEIFNHHIRFSGDNGRHEAGHAASGQTQAHIVNRCIILKRR